MGQRVNKFSKINLLKVVVAKASLNKAFS